MRQYRGNEELISLLNMHQDPTFVDFNFMELLRHYPDDIFSVALSSDYKEYFDIAIKNNMPQILLFLIENNRFPYMFELASAYEKEFTDNMDIILDYDESYMVHFPELVTTRAFETYSRRAQEKILEKALSFKEYQFPDNYNSNLLFFLSAFPFFEEEYANKNKVKIQKFVDDMFNKIDPECFRERDLLFFTDAIIYSSRNHPFFKKFVSKHLEYFALCLTNKKIDTLKRNNKLDFYVNLIKTTIDQENADISDISIKAGANSRVLIIKDKVLKSGTKKTKSIPYHRRILQPLIRVEILYEKEMFASILGQKRVPFDFIEKYHRTGEIPLDQARNITYMVFKEMLDDGILFGDPNFDNLGILLRPNVIEKESVDIENNPFYIDEADVINETDVLKPGDAVVRDIDVLYDVRKLNIREKIEQGIKEKGDFSFEDLGHLLASVNEIAFLGPHLQMYFNQYVNEIKETMDNPEENYNK